MVGLTVLVAIMTLLGRWFYQQRQVQARMMRINDIQENARRIFWKIGQELRTSRVVVWPQSNADGSPRSDDLVTFKNFRGEIVSYWHDAATRTIRRCVVPNGPGDPVIDPTPVGQSVGSATFTVMRRENKLVSLRLSTDGIEMLDATQLLND